MTEYSNKPDLEKFVDAVAAAILIPKNQLLNDPIVKTHNSADQKWTEAELKKLQRKFWVSQESILRRLLSFSRTNNSFYQQKREEWINLPLKKGGFELPHEKAFRSNFEIFLNVLMEAYNQKQITSAKLSNLLGMKLKHLKDFEKLLY